MLGEGPLRHHLVIHPECGHHTLHLRHLIESPPLMATAGITEEFSKGDIVTFGHSKEQYEIIEAKVLKKSEST